MMGTFKNGLMIFGAGMFAAGSGLVNTGLGASKGWMIGAGVFAMTVGMTMHFMMNAKGDKAKGAMGD